MNAWTGEATSEEQEQAHQRNENKAIRIDGFSDRVDNMLRVPNDMFFSASEDEPGLIDLFQQYQFTAEESTPVDQEVALDPELLGQVFENLLASYNPETGVTARKQTGSFYTPREIVNYMVEETLVRLLRNNAIQRMATARSGRTDCVTCWIMPGISMMQENGSTKTKPKTLSAPLPD